MSALYFLFFLHILSSSVLQRLKEAAHVCHNTGEMGPLAVESVSEGCIGSMRLSDGNL